MRGAGGRGNIKNNEALVHKEILFPKLIPRLISVDSVFMQMSFKLAHNCSSSVDFIIFCNTNYGQSSITIVYDLYFIEM